MSDESLFSRHLKLIENDESTWSEKDREEFARLKSLRLPPLELKPSFWNRWKMQIQVGVTAAALVSLTLILVPKLQKEEDTFRAKGSLQVSVFWERQGKVSPLTDDSVLQDGDKVSATVISSEDGIAYWTITDSKMNVLVPQDKILSSQIELKEGKLASFKEFSFELKAPNEGENLLVVVCPKSKKVPEAKPIDSFFNREFVTQLLTEQRVNASDCVFVGYRLRRLP